MQWRVAGCVTALIVIALSTTYAQQPVTRTGDTMTRARTGAGFGFSLAFELLPHTEVIPEGISPDGEWVKIIHEDTPAWVQHSVLTPLDVSLLPVLNDLPPAPELSAENCISLIGDSVAYGSVVYIIPGQGFAILRTTPVSIVLQDALQKRGLGYLEVRDRSAEAAFLSEAGKNPYYEMASYQALLEDRCRLTVIMPWVNDLSVVRDNPAQAHIDDLVNLVQRLNTVNPAAQNFILGFYYGEPSEFAREHAPGYYDENITAFNEVFRTACESDGELAVFENVICMETASWFIDPENNHVALAASRSELMNLLYEAIPADFQPLFDAYWSNNPDAAVLGDGVHLSAQGKNILVQSLIGEFLGIFPDL